MVETKNTHGGARAGAGRKKGGKNSAPSKRKDVTRSEIVYVRMTPEQKETLRADAEKAGMKMSDYIISKLF